MRVGVDMHSVGGIHQGIRTHLLELYAQAVLLAPEIDFIFLGVEQQALESFHVSYRAENVYTAVMPHSNPLKRLLRQLPALERQHALDLLHVQYVMPFRNTAKVAVTIHDVLFETYTAYFTRFFRLRSTVLMRYASRAADVVFTVSDFSRREIAERYGAALEGIHVTPNAADPVRFHPVGPAAGEEEQAVLSRWNLKRRGYVLSVGRLEPRKNYAVLLRAYAQLQDPPPLVIVGQTDFRFQEIFTLITELGLKDVVRICSDVGVNELPTLYRHTLAFVYPSVAEGFGMPVMEAFASGVPVICSDSTALTEIAEGAALLVEPNSVSSLQAALVQLLGDRELQMRLGMAGLERSRQYSWKRSAEVLVKHLRLALMPTKMA